MDINQYQTDGLPPAATVVASSGNRFHRVGVSGVIGVADGVYGSAPSLMNGDLVTNWLAACKDSGGGGLGGSNGNGDMRVKSEPMEMMMSSTATFQLDPHDADMVSTATSVCSLDKEQQQQQQQQQFIACRVCSDKASGYHYGVTSCEGCKGFFRRSMQKQMEYRCLRDGKCQVMRLNRNRCQFCRFQKCLAVGMSRDSVRYGRVPKRSLSTDDAQQQPMSTTGGGVMGMGSSDPSQSHYESSFNTGEADSGAEEDMGRSLAAAAAMMESHQLALYDVILSVSHSHTAHCDVTEDKVLNLARRQATLLTRPMQGSKLLQLNDKREACRCIMFQNVTALITPSINKVVEFSKRIPDFQSLSQDDQLTLIKTGFYEIWLTRMARLLNAGTPQMEVLFPDGSLIQRKELDMVYGCELMAAVFEFAHNFSQLLLNDTEVGLVTSLVLTTTDRAGLVNVEAIHAVRKKLCEALQLQLSRNHGNEPHLYQAITARLPELRILSSAHDQQLDWFRARWRYLVLPPLYAEIYDIAKEEEEEDDREEEEEEEDVGGTEVVGRRGSGGRNTGNDAAAAQAM